MTTRPVRIESMAHGGDGVARIDGRVAFVGGAIPGDEVTVAVTAEKQRYLRGVVAEIRTPSPDRIGPPCPVFDRCGGCDWQMGSLAAQRRWKADIVRGQLAHLGGVDDPPVTSTVGVGPGFGYRNRIDVRISNGRPALYEAGSHRPVEIDDCPLVVPPISERLRRLAPGPGTERVTLRASTRTGHVTELARRRGRWETGTTSETVADVTFRITGRAFFQVNTPGAEALVGLVRDHLRVRDDERMLDGFAGGGLFSATVGAGVGRVVAVESDPLAGSDCAVNAPDARLVRRPFEEAGAAIGSVDVAVVDPPRTGLGPGGVEVLAGSGAERLAYVSCDPASFARDTAGLVAAGFDLVAVTPVDMFPNTHHVEIVGSFQR